MCDRCLDYAAFSHELGLGLTNAYAAELAREDLRAEGLVRLTFGGPEVNPAGQPLLRGIVMRFEPRFTGAPSVTRRCAGAPRRRAGGRP